MASQSISVPLWDPHQPSPRLCYLPAAPQGRHGDEVVLVVLLLLPGHALTVPAVTQLQSALGQQSPSLACANLLLLSLVQGQPETVQEALRFTMDVIGGK